MMNFCVAKISNFVANDLMMSKTGLVVVNDIFSRLCGALMS